MLVDPLVFLAFVPAALALNLTPGADMMFCLAQGMKGGAKPSIAASAGISTGAMIHVMIAGLGLGTLVNAMPWVFEVIRWAGVAYLVWLAFKTLRTHTELGEMPDIRPSRAFREALLVNLTNPKVILFILAFVPQFVDPARASVLAQFLVFGGVIAVGGFIVNSLVGIFAGSLGRWIARDPRVDRVLRYLSSGIFGLLALKLATEARA